MTSIWQNIQQTWKGESLQSGMPKYTKAETKLKVTRKKKVVHEVQQEEQPHTTEQRDSGRNFV